MSYVVLRSRPIDFPIGRDNRYAYRTRSPGAPGLDDVAGAVL